MGFNGFRAGGPGGAVGGLVGIRRDSGIRDPHLRVVGWLAGDVGLRPFEPLVVGVLVFPKDEAHSLIERPPVVFRGTRNAELVDLDVVACILSEFKSALPVRCWHIKLSRAGTRSRLL